MKLLRILTGVHAGASIPLAAGDHRIAGDDDADVQISDWQNAPLTITIAVDGGASAQRQSDADAQSTFLPLADFAPQRFNDIVLCLGPESGAWPSDLELMNELLVGQDESLVNMKRLVALSNVELGIGRRRVSAFALAGVVLAVLLVGLTGLSAVRNTQASEASDVGSTARRVETMLTSAGIKGLTVQQQGSAVMVSGMVSSPSDDMGVRAVLDKFDANIVQRHYDIASALAQSIQETLAVPGAQVRYAGRGAFTVYGEVASLSGLNDAIARVRADLDPNVKRLDVQATEKPPSETSVPFTTMMTNGTFKYLQTPDGVKHFYVEDAPDQTGS
jgi:type III secretion protein D